MQIGKQIAQLVVRELRRGHHTRPCRITCVIRSSVVARLKAWLFTLVSACNPGPFKGCVVVG